MFAYALFELFLRNLWESTGICGNLWESVGIYDLRLFIVVCTLLYCHIHVVISDFTADLTKALDDVENLLKDLLGMGKLDLATLENAERRFKIANDTIVGKLDVELERMKKASASQLDQINQYELDLGPLEKEIKHVEDLYKTLPRQCMKPAPPPA